MEALAKKTIAGKINGVEHMDEVEPRPLLVDYLRDRIGLTGTHVGCDTSMCGACTMLAVRLTAQTS